MLHSWPLLPLLLVLASTITVTHAISPISSYTKKMIQQFHQEVFGSISSSSGVFIETKKQQRGALQEPKAHAAKECPVTTTMYINYYTDELYPIADKTTSIFTSLGGEDDDNNGSNNGPNVQKPLDLLRTVLLFTMGAICTIPFTEFVLDPVILTWAFAFFGWLSYEEYDYPNTEGEVYYPGCTDRQYFMTDDELAEQEALEYAKQFYPQQQNALSHTSNPPRGGGHELRASSPTNRLKRRSITFFGIQAGMIVLGDWLVRWLLPKSAVDGIDVKIPGWLDVFSFPLQVIAIICSMVVQFRIQQHQVEFSNVMASMNSPQSTQSKQPPQQHAIPYWLGYYMDHIAILLPIALLAFEFLFDSNILWNGLTRLLSRHVGLDGHGTFTPFLVNRAFEQ